MNHLCIKVKNKIVIEYLQYEIMTLNMHEYSKIVNEECSLLASCIKNPDNFNSLDGGTFSVQLMKRYFNDNPGKVEVFSYKNLNEELIGYLLCFYKGSSDIHFSIQTREAYITDVCVFPNYCGNGYGYEIMKSILSYLVLVRGVTDICLACRPYNTVALKLYNKLGFKTTEKRRMIRFLGHNIPKHFL